MTLGGSLKGSFCLHLHRKKVVSINRAVFSGHKTCVWTVQVSCVKTGHWMNVNSGFMKGPQGVDLCTCKLQCQPDGF